MCLQSKNHDLLELNKYTLETLRYTVPNQSPVQVLIYTAISRNRIVGENVHATIPKGNLGYDQYTVPDTVAVEPILLLRSCALENISPWPLEPLF